MERTWRAILTGSRPLFVSRNAFPGSRSLSRGLSGSSCLVACGVVVLLTRLPALAPFLAPPLRLTPLSDFPRWIRSLFTYQSLVTPGLVLHSLLRFGVSLPSDVLLTPFFLRRDGSLTLLRALTIFFIWLGCTRMLVPSPAPPQPAPPAPPSFFFLRCTFLLPPR